jgi:hypothetical protein
MKGVLASLAQMQETLTKMSTKPAVDEDAEDGEPEAPKKSVEDPKATKRFTRLEKELAEEREARKKAERIQAEQAESAKRNEMRGQFQQALTEHGISDPRLMRAALDQLEQDGFMVRDEGDKIRFKGNDKYGIETLFDPKVGLKNWVQQEGKSFVPAVDAGGSGSNPARNNMGSNPSKGEFSKLSAAQKAAIEIDRASQGLPPLE